MTYIEYPDKRFMVKFDRYEPTIMDSTAAVLRDDCKRKYFYRLVLGRTPRIHENQTVFDFGTAYHKYKEILRRTGDFKGAIEEALKIPIHTPSPKPKFAYLTKGFLMKAAYVAYEQWEKEQEQGKIKLISNMTEQALNVQMPDGTFIGGRLDAAIKWAGMNIPEDDKTSSKNLDIFNAEKSLDDQTTRYIYIFSEITKEPIGTVMFNVLFHAQEGKKEDKKDKISVVRTPANRTPAQLKSWERDEIFKNAELQVNRDKDHWPMESGYKCNFCEYKFVCRQNTELGQIAKLESDFVVKPWEFMKTEQTEVNP